MEVQISRLNFFTNFGAESFVEVRKLIDNLESLKEHMCQDISIAEDRKEQVLQQYRRSKITYFGGYEKYYLSALNLLGSMEVATSDEEIHKLFSTGLYLMELGRFDESEQKIFRCSKGD